MAGGKAPCHAGDQRLHAQGGEEEGQAPPLQGPKQKLKGKRRVVSRVGRMGSAWLLQPHVRKGPWEQGQCPGLPMGVGLSCQC